MEDLEISGPVRIPAAALSVKAVRSGGPGGQNVNKVASKVEIRVDLTLVEGLSDAALARLRARVANATDAEGRWIVISSRTRDQVVNLQDARTKITRVVLDALPDPVPRRATRPTLGSRLRRVDGKRRDGDVKRGRSRKDWD
jgi:ribosome-associated protein